MGTRGAIGYRADQKDFITYNHFDSYPDGLGDDVVKAVKKLLAEGSVEELREKVVNMRLVDGSASTATPEDIKKFKEHLNLSVSTQDPSDWYCLLREAQGRIELYPKLGVMIDSASFMQDSLFCEYAYIVNLDTGELEFYEGFQSGEQPEGRYAGEMSKPAYEGGTGYWGVALVGTCPLDDIPDDWQERFYSVEAEDGSEAA